MQTHNITVLRLCDSATLREFADTHVAKLKMVLRHGRVRFAMVDSWGKALTPEFAGAQELLDHIHLLVRS